MNGALLCAARNHAMDMGTRDYVDHDTPEGLAPAERLDEAGYSGSMWGESIAWGYAALQDYEAQAKVRQKPTAPAAQE